MSLVEKYWFKTRYIVNYPEVGSDDAFCVESFAMTDPLLLALKPACTPRLAELVETRQGLARWRLFIFRQDNLIKGYSFLHVPAQTEWNDSLPTLPSQARTSSTFVEPGYRGQGIRAKMLWAQFLFSKNAGRLLWAVIEKSNASSLRATEKSGGVRARTNYLMKFAGRNVFSILNNPFEVFLLIGNRRNRI